MKRLITLLILLFALFPQAMHAQAQKTPELKLRSCNSISNFDYTYISPLMLKAMQQKELKDLRGLPAEKVTQIEILKTGSNGQDDRFKSVINKLADEPGFKLLAYNSDKADGVKICIDSSSDIDSDVSPGEEIINRLLVIQWGAYGARHTVLYIVGKFSLSDVNSLLHF